MLEEANEDGLDILHKMKTRVRLRDIRDNRWIYVHYCLETYLSEM